MSLEGTYHNAQIPFQNVTLDSDEHPPTFRGCSLAKFYGQYADRHMDLKFMRLVNERERAIRQFLIVRNKLMSVCNASVLLLTINFVITLSK